MNRWRCALLSLLLGCAPVTASEEAPAGFPPSALETFLDTAAQETGLPRPWLEATLRQATFQPDIIAAISRPAERTLTWGQYRALFLKPDRVEAGLAFYAAHRQTVDAVAEAYGVSWPYVLAILGIETRYGKFFGRWRVLDALTTLGLAYPPRQAFLLASCAFSSSKCTPRGWIYGSLRLLRRGHGLRAVHSQQLPGFRRGF